MPDKIPSEVSEWMREINKKRKQHKGHPIKFTDEKHEKHRAYMKAYRDRKKEEKDDKHNSGTNK